MSKKVKTFAIVVLIIAAIIGISTYFSNPSDTSSDTPLSSSASPVAGVPLNTSDTPPETEFSILLSSIKDITIDTSIFTDPAYLTLRDSPIALGSDIQGRPNPFAPVGSDTGTISGLMPTTQAQFETLQPGKITATTAEFGAQALLGDTSQAKVVFEYGTNDLLSSATAPIALSQNGTALVRVSDLSPATTYYVRAVLAQGSNTTVGETMTFTTTASR